MLTLVSAPRLHRRLHEQYCAARKRETGKARPVSDALTLAYAEAFNLTFSAAAVCISVPDFGDIEAESET